MKKRIAKVMLLGAVLPGGVHAAEMKSNSHSLPGKVQETSQLAQGKVQEKSAFVLTAQSVSQENMNELVAQAEQEKQVANSSESKEPPFHLKGVRG